MMQLLFNLSFLCLLIPNQAFLTPTSTQPWSNTRSMSSILLSATQGEDDNTNSKAVSMVTGEDLELLLQNMEQPLVVDAYATWCGPCLLMAPEFEQAAQELKGKVKFVKLDTDQEEEMASRLNIMGLPTLLFLDKYNDESNPEARAVLKGRIEGAMQKKSILELVDHYFFDGPAPQLF